MKVTLATNLLSMTEYDRRAGLPSANYAQFCLELIAFVASHPALRDESHNEQLLAWMDDAAAADRMMGEGAEIGAQPWRHQAD